MKKHKGKILDQPAQSTPLWMLLVVIVSILPVIAWPWYMLRYGLQEHGGQTAFLAIAFPIYIVLCGYLAYKCFQYRKEVTYILIAIMWLSYAAALFL